MAIRGNVKTLADSRFWHDIVTNRINPAAGDEDRSFISGAARLLPPEPWGASTWKTWTEDVKAATGRKGKALFMPLRLALTGLDHGPELAQLLPLNGRQKALERLT